MASATPPPAGDPAAARAGAGQLSIGALRSGQVEIDPARAIEASDAYLDSVGQAGQTSVVGQTVTVHIVGQESTVILGIVLMYVWMAFRPAFFRGEILNRDTPTRVPQDIGTPVGLFGIEPTGEAEQQTESKPG